MWHGRHHGFDGIPTIPNAVGNSTAFHTLHSAPVGKAFRFSANCNQRSEGTVIRLFPSGRPTAIYRMPQCNTLLAFAAPITAIIVNAIYRMSRRGARSQIFNERDKRIVPATAHLNTATTIPGVFVAMGIITTVFDFTINVIFRRLVHAVYSICPRAFPVKTPTTQSTFIADGRAVDFGDTATDTLTKPHTVAVASVGARIAQHGQSPQRVSFNINETARRWFGKKLDLRNVIFFSSHYKNLLNRFAFWLGSIKDPNLWSNCVYFTTNSGI